MLTAEEKPPKARRPCVFHWMMKNSPICPKCKTACKCKSTPTLDPEHPETRYQRRYCETCDYMVVTTYKVDLVTGEVTILSDDSGR